MMTAARRALQLLVQEVMRHNVDCPAIPRGASIIHPVPCSCGHDDALRALDNLTMDDGLKEYQRNVLLTANPKAMAGEEAGQLFGALMLATEAGEAAELIRKRWYQGHPWGEEQQAHLVKELGDLMWGFAFLCHISGIDPSQVLATNIEKLKARYPEGHFSAERSIHRAPGDV